MGALFGMFSADNPANSDIEEQNLIRRLKKKRKPKQHL
jgi:hypothetical protein